MKLKNSLSLHILAVLAIFICALFFRLVDLGSLPAGFHLDEANAGYNAYSIIKTGSNIYSEHLPLYLNTFGDYRPMGIIYLMVPTIVLLGLTETAVRLPAALFGALTPVLLYIVVWQLFKKRSVAILSALLLAISPWHIVLSRATAEQVLGIFMVLLITIFALLSFERKRFWLVFAYISLVASFWTYTAINLFILLFLPLLSVYLYTHFKNRTTFKLWLLVVTIYFIFPVATSVFYGQAVGRARQVVNPYSQELINKFLSQEPSSSSVSVTKLFHNKPIITLFTVGERYTDYFSGKFLFFKGGIPGRYQIPEVGLINILTLVGVVLWFLKFPSHWKDSQNRHALFLVLGWLLISPVIAAITSDDHPNMSRASIMVLPLLIIGSLGLVTINDSLKKPQIKRGLFIVLAGIGLWHFGYFWHEYTIHAKGDEWLSRNYASRTAARKLSKVPKQYSVLATTQVFDTPAYILFFQKTDPRIAQEAYKNIGKGKLHIENYYFTNENACASKTVERAEYNVYLDSSWCDEPDWSTVVPIPVANGSVGAKILIDKTVILEDLKL